MTRLFGTDGIRGVANEEPLTPELAFRVAVSSSRPSRWITASATPGSSSAATPALGAAPRGRPHLGLSIFRC